MPATSLAFVNLLMNLGSLTTNTSTSNRPITTHMSSAGNLLAAFVAWNSATMTLNSVTDTQSNTWTIMGTITNTNVRGALAVCYAPKRLVAGVDTISFNFSAGSVGAAAQVAEFVGVKATGTPGDGSSTNTGTGVSPTFTSNNVATANANDLLLGLFFYDTTPSGGSAITPTNSFTRVGTGTTFVNGALCGAYRIVSATGNYAYTGTTATGTTSVPWGAGVWAFKQSDTAAPEVSFAGAEVAQSGASRAASFVGAEIAKSGPSRAISFVGVEVALVAAAGITGNAVVTQTAASVAATGTVTTPSGVTTIPFAVCAM